MNRRHISHFVQIALIAAFVFGATSTPAQGEGPVPPEKIAPNDLLATAEPGSYTDAPPEPGSKNDGAIAIPVDDSPGAAEILLPEPGSKNEADPSALAAGEAISLEQITSSGPLISCGAAPTTTWQSVSSAFTTIVQCSLQVPQSGWLFISADASLGRINSEYEAQFALSFGDLLPIPETYRWVNIYYDGGDGTDKNTAVSTLRPVSAGTHTLHFLGRRYSGTGTLQVYDPSLSVVFIPASGTDLRVCGDSRVTSFSTISSAFATMRQCTLTIPQSGYVFVSADASVGNSSGPFEARFGLGFNGTAVDISTNRYINIYNDTGDGSDENTRVTLLKAVGPGTYTFNYLAARFNGSGTALVYNPSLSVIYIPAASTNAVACGADGGTWSTTNSAFTAIKQCALNVPKAGWVFLSANASMIQADGAVEAQYSLTVDSLVGDSQADRWVNVYTDSGDGTDKNVAVSVLKYVSAGTHTFYFVGRRYSGLGQVVLINPTLSALTPGSAVVTQYKIYLPLVRR